MWRVGGDVRGSCGVSGRASSGSGGWSIGSTSGGVRRKGESTCFSNSQFAGFPQPRGLNGFTWSAVFRVLNFEKVQNTLRAIRRPQS